MQFKARAYSNQACPTSQSEDFVVVVKFHPSAPRALVIHDLESTTKYIGDRGKWTLHIDKSTSKFSIRHLNKSQGQPSRQNCILKKKTTGYSNFPNPEATVIFRRLHPTKARETFTQF